MKLVWAGEFETKDEARTHERKLKRWKPARKETLIEDDKEITEQIINNKNIQD